MPALEIPSDFAAAVGAAPARGTHALGDHPLLTPEAVADLADRLPPASVEHNRGALPAVVADDAVETLDQTPGEIARGIDHNGCWMVLKNIEQDPAYARLLREMLDQVAPHLDPAQGTMRRRKGFLFLSAPNSVTPSHFDPEHNFLLQVRGSKTIWRVLTALNTGNHLLYYLVGRRRRSR